MIHRRHALMGAVAAVTAPAAAQAASRRPQRVLYLSQSAGWRHAPVSRPGDGGLSMSERTMDEIGRASDAFTLRTTQDASEITPALLAQLDVLVFYTTGALPVSPQSWQAIQAWIASGRGGFVGLHSATDTSLDFPGGRDSYIGLIGGEFAEHPWNEGEPISVRAYGQHATTAMWPEVFDYREEIYQHRDLDPARVRVLQGLDFARTPLKTPWAIPVTWVRQVGHGRVFYTNLGHTPSTWSDPRFRDQIVQAIQWAGGSGRAEADPNPLQQAIHGIEALLNYADEDPAVAAALIGERPAWLLDMGRRIAALQGLQNDEDEQNAAVSALRDEIMDRA